MTDKKELSREMAAEELSIAARSLYIVSNYAVLTNNEPLLKSLGSCAHHLLDAVDEI